MADREALLRRLAHAELGGLRSRTTGCMISPSIQKTLLFVIAMHEGERITIDQVASLAGLAHSTAAHALNGLQDAGLLERVLNPAAGTLPAAAKASVAMGYRVNWRAVVATPLADVDPTRISMYAKRKAVTA